MCTRLFKGCRSNLCVSAFAHARTAIGLLRGGNQRKNYGALLERSGFRMFVSFRGSRAEEGQFIRRLRPKAGRGT